MAAEETSACRARFDQQRRSTTTSSSSVASPAVWPQLLSIACEASCVALPGFHATQHPHVQAAHASVLKAGVSVSILQLRFSDTCAESAILPYVERLSVWVVRSWHVANTNFAGSSQCSRQLCCGIMAHVPGAYLHSAVTTAAISSTCCRQAGYLDLLCGPVPC